MIKKKIKITQKQAFQIIQKILLHFIGSIKATRALIQFRYNYNA